MQKSLNLYVKHKAEIAIQYRHGSGNSLEICVKNLTSYVMDLMKGFKDQEVITTKFEKFRRGTGII